MNRSLKEQVSAVLFTLNSSYLMIGEEISHVKHELFKQLCTTETEMQNRYDAADNAAVMDEELRSKFMVIRECILSSLRMNIIIENIDGLKTEVIEPLGMDYKNGNYYLVANSVCINQCNYYKLNDIKGVENRRERFRYGGCFNLAVKQCSADKWNRCEGPPVNVKIKLYGEGKKLLKNKNKNIKVIHVSSGEDYEIYELTAYGYEGIKAWLLGSPYRLEVLEPLELSKQIQDTLFQLMKIYK
jgi:predicted DNA-binding transcriptional regulator YafY